SGNFDGTKAGTSAHQARRVARTRACQKGLRLVAEPSEHPSQGVRQVSVECAPADAPGRRVEADILTARQHVGRKQPAFTVLNGKEAARLPQHVPGFEDGGGVRVCVELSNLRRHLETET